MPKVSVIIPVYNVELYLSRCLYSVINQTFEDMEIICINDGSTDGSLAILKEFAQKDSRIKLIDLPQNHGVSFARNKGIESSKGEYVAFLDPDDWWELNLLEIVYKKIKLHNQEIAIFGSSFFKNNVILSNETQLSYISQHENQQKITTYQNNLVNYAWDKLYKTEFLKKNNIKFNENLPQTEDVIFSLECLSYYPTISFVPKNLYNYQLNRNGSAMTKETLLVSNQIKAFKALQECNFFINSNDDYKKFCINVVLGGLIYFYIRTTQKKFSLSNFLELRKFAQYIKTEIPPDLLNKNESYKILNDITAVSLSKGVSCLEKQEKTNV